MVSFVGCRALGANTAECLEKHVFFSLGYLVGTAPGSLDCEALPQVLQRDGVTGWGTEECETACKFWEDEGSAEVFC